MAFAVRGRERERERERAHVTGEREGGGVGGRERKRERERERERERQGDGKHMTHVSEGYATPRVYSDSGQRSRSELSWTPTLSNSHQLSSTRTNTHQLLSTCMHTTQHFVCSVECVFEEPRKHHRHCGTIIISSCSEALPNTSQHTHANTHLSKVYDVKSDLGTERLASLFGCSR